MKDKISRGRLAERWPGKAAAAFIALAWIAGMSMSDGNAYTMVPVMALLGAALLAGAAGALAGYKMVKMPLLAWLSLLAGGYFVVRSLSSYSVVEGWRDASLALSAIVFYVAGVYAGQGGGSRGIASVLAVALLANMAAMALMRDPGISQVWLGRPEIGLTGANSRPTTLFVYKNFASLFLLLAGSLLIWLAIWPGRWRIRSLFLGAAGGAGALLSFECGSRLPVFMAPLLAVAGWVLWFVMRLFHQRHLGWGAALTGMALLTALLIAVYDFFFGHSIVSALLDVDSHLRFLIWASVCRAAQAAPLWGYGSGASQWEILGFYNEWQTPNFAHNEYLQLWCDDGMTGLFFALFIIVAHAVQGFRAIGSELAEEGRRIKAAMALLALLALSVAAATDFVWHHFSLLSMGAFACGVLASPFPHEPWALLHRRRWAPGSRTTLVKAQGPLGRVAVAAVGLAVLAGLARMELILYPGWKLQWRYNSLAERNAGFESRRALLGQAVEAYPDTQIMDCYIALPCQPETVDWQEAERLLRIVLQANPRQLFTVTMLATVLGRQGRFEEADALYRLYYPGDGPDSSLLSGWGSFYGVNLLQWGQQALSAGDLAKGRSLLDYGMAVCKKQGMYPNTSWRGGLRCWTDGGSPAHRQFIKCCQADQQTLERLGIIPDDSWRGPAPPSGRPALYARNQEEKKR